MSVAQSPDCDADGLIGVEAARAFLLERARAPQVVEVVPVAEARGRVLARTLHATSDVPPYDNSAMDGYALRGEDLVAGGDLRLPVTQRIPAGTMGQPLRSGEAARIFTGAPIPEGADTVVMQEQCTRDGDTVLISGPLAAGDNVRPRGNDVRAGQAVLSAGIRLRPQEMGVAASLGCATVEVYRRPRVAFFSSGDELLEPGAPPRPGAIYNSNRYTLYGLIDALGCEGLDLGTVADTLPATRALLDQGAARADVLVSTGGVSVGEEDHIKRALDEVGHMALWRIAVKPGKPLAYGRIGQADFLGLPGNPVSTLLTFCLFARPFLLRRMGATEVLPRGLPVVVEAARPRPGRRREYVRARVHGGDDGRLHAELYPRQGSEVLSSASWADGVVEIPEGRTVEPGDTLTYYSFNELLN